VSGRAPGPDLDTIDALASMIGRCLLMMEIDVLGPRHAGSLVRIWDARSSSVAHVSDLQ